MTASVIRVGLMGDMFPADLPNSLGIGVGSVFSNANHDNWIRHFSQFTSGNDLNFCNLEAPLVLDANEKLSAPFAGYVDFAGILHRSNIGVVSIANNHILEQGAKGFRRTIKTLAENQVQYIGSNQSIGPNVVNLEIGGLQLGFTGFSDVYNRQYQPGTYAKYSEEQLLLTLRRMKEEGTEFIFVSLHWGDEYCKIPSFDQIEVAHKAIDHGADIIIGHHPHVIQPIERYRHGLIFYSLGNFLFDMNWSREVRTGMFATITISPTLEVSYQIRPTYLGNDYRPVEISEDLSTNTFWKSLNHHTKLMTDLQVDKKVYGRYYRRNRKRNQFYQRYKMKEFLLFGIHKLPSHLRRQILRNWYLKLMGNLG